MMGLSSSGVCGVDVVRFGVVECGRCKLVCFSVVFPGVVRCDVVFCGVVYLSPFFIPKCSIPLTRSDNSLHLSNSLS